MITAILVGIGSSFICFAIGHEYGWRKCSEFYQEKLQLFLTIKEADDILLKIDAEIERSNR